MIYTFGYRLFIFRDFIHLLSKVATISKDTSPLYVRIGPLQGEIIIICICIVISLLFSIYMLIVGSYIDENLCTDSM